MRVMEEVVVAMMMMMMICNDNSRRQLSKQMVSASRVCKMQRAMCNVLGRSVLCGAVLCGAMADGCMPSISRPAWRRSRRAAEGGHRPAAASRQPPAASACRVPSRVPSFLDPRRPSPVARRPLPVTLSLSPAPRRSPLAALGPPPPSGWMGERLLLPPDARPASAPSTPPRQCCPLSTPSSPRRARDTHMRVPLREPSLPLPRPRPRC
jgi:hypothetical protein